MKFTLLSLLLGFSLSAQALMMKTATGGGSSSAGSIHASAIRKGTSNNFACGGFANKITFTSSDAVSGSSYTNDQLTTANGFTALATGLHLVSVTATSIDSPGSMLQLSYALNAASPVDVIAVSGRDGTSRVVAHTTFLLSLTAADVVYFYCNGPNVDTIMASIHEVLPR